MYECPHCKEPMEYMGVEDGAGDYGDEFTELHKCQYCGERVEVPVSFGGPDHFMNQFDDGAEMRDTREDGIL